MYEDKKVLVSNNIKNRDKKLHKFSSFKIDRPWYAFHTK